MFTTRRYAEWLKERLDERGWTQKDLTIASGVGQNRISAILNERVAEISVEQAIGFALAFDSEPTQVLLELGMWPPSKQEPLRFVAETRYGYRRPRLEPEQEIPGSDIPQKRAASSEEPIQEDE